MASTEAEKRRSKKYDAANVTQYNLRLNKKTDADLLALLADLRASGRSMQGWIKEAMREKAAKERQNSGKD